MRTYSSKIVTVWALRHVLASLLQPSCSDCVAKTWYLFKSLCHDKKAFQHTNESWLCRENIFHPTLSIFFRKRTLFYSQYIFFAELILSFLASSVPLIITPVQELFLQGHEKQLLNPLWKNRVNKLQFFSVWQKYFYYFFPSNPSLNFLWSVNVSCSYSTWRRN